MTGTADGKDTYLSNFSLFEQSAAAGKQGWLHGKRRAAIARFAELGFPSTRAEDWRYTNVAPIAQAAFKPAGYEQNGLTSADIENYTFGELECCRFVFINGVFSHEFSSFRCSSRGARLMSLAAALETERNYVEPYLAQYASWDKNAFTALNTAFVADGAFVFLPPGSVMKETIHLLYLSTSRGHPTVSHPRNLIVAGSGSRVSIVESHVGLEKGVYFTNAVTEIVVGKDAVVDYYRQQRESESAYHVSTVQVAQEASSAFSSHSISLGGSLVRSDVNVLLNGEGGDCTLNGLYVTKARQHVDNHTSIDHAKPHCTSRELYKGILDEKSSGVFNGRILVRKDAQKTNARQTNKNLLLSEEALVNTKPQLEIFADDVKCTHGATIGQLEEESLFYLRSRGIDEKSARTLLTYAFASDIVGNIKIKPFQCQLDLVLLTRLSRV